MGQGSFIISMATIVTLIPSYSLKILSSQCFFFAFLSKIGARIGDNCYCAIMIGEERMKCFSVKSSVQSQVVCVRSSVRAVGRSENLGVHADIVKTLVPRLFIAGNSFLEIRSRKFIPGNSFPEIHSKPRFSGNCS